MTTPSTPVCVAEFEQLAKKKCLRDKKLAALWYYIQLASGDRQTYRESEEAFKRFRFQPRILTAKPRQSLWTTVLGQPISIPIGISPTVGYKAVHSDGAAVAGRAACRAGTVMTLSSVGDTAIEAFAASVPENGVYWAQTYLFRDKRNTLHIIKNAEKHGFGALVVTVDAPVERQGAAFEQKDIMKMYSQLPIETPSPNMIYVGGKARDSTKPMTLSEIWDHRGPSDTYCYADWEDLRWLKSQTNLPIVLKGVLSAESARRAANFGVSGILVSAHGGRQIDGVPAPLDALPDVVNAVKGTNVEVYMDGGIRTGNDVVKALALGARAVFIGRPALYGAAVNGEEGVFQVLKILEKELMTCMALCGCSSVRDIGRSIVKHETEFHPKL